MESSNRSLTNSAAAAPASAGDDLPESFAAPAKVYADFIVRLSLKYATLAEVHAAGRTRHRKLCFATGTKHKIEQRLDVLLAAKPLSTAWPHPRFEHHAANQPRPTTR